MSKKISIIAWVLLILLALIWGTSFILIKRGLLVYSAGEVGALRILFAGVFLLPFALRKIHKLNKRNLSLLFFVGLFGSFIPAFLFAKAQTQIDSSLAGVLNALTPLFVMLIGAIFFSQKISSKVGVGMFIGFVGSVFLIAAGTGTDLTAINYYALFVVGATVCYGANINLIKFKITEVDAISITAISLMLVIPFAAGYLFGVSDFVYKVNHVEGAHVALGYITLLGVVGTAIALVIFNYLVKITTPIFTSSVTYLIPVVAVVWGIVDGEALLLGHFIGMVGIIGGVFLANKKK